MAGAATGTMTKQYWFCESCKRVGSVLTDPDADVMTVVYLIGDNHREISPDCKQTVYGIRVFDEKDLAKKPKAFPGWVHERFKALAD